MLSDMIRDSRHALRHASQDIIQALDEALPGFATNLHLWETSARDMEMRVETMDRLARAKSAKTGGALAESASTQREQIHRCARPVHGQPEIARRISPGGGR